MKLILASEKDPAAQNIAARLLELYDFEPTSRQPEVYVCGNLRLAKITDEAVRIARVPFPTDEIIFASRHASVTGEPTLTVHVPGDLKTHKLAIAAPQTVKAALRALVAARDELSLPYQVSLEATHHGPTDLPVPITFVEVGSSPAQWRDLKAAEAVARAIMAAAMTPVGKRCAIGFGGPHYAPRHTQVVLQTDVCIGHVFPKYAKLDEKLIQSAIARTRGDVELLVLDWKGLTSVQRRLLCQLGDKIGIPTARTRDLLSTQKA
jgi:D-aminoacyl-tRNA deacylase